MNKIKDLLYDKSDILIALAILLIAGLIIGWRLAAIVEYPKSIIDDNNNATEYNENIETDDPEDTPNNTDAEDPENTTTDIPENTPENTPTTTSVWDSNGLLAKDVTVNLQGAYAYAIVQCAVDAGLFESYNDYANVCLNNGITNPDQIQSSGEKTFKAGLSKFQVAEKIKNNS